MCNYYIEFHIHHDLVHTTFRGEKGQFAFYVRNYPPIDLACAVSYLQVKLRHADQEIRLAQDPFPLYPGEKLQQVVAPLKVVQANTALRIRAILDFEEEDGMKRVAGDEWLFEGPGLWAYVWGVCACLWMCVCMWGGGVL